MSFSRSSPYAICLAILAVGGTSIDSPVRPRRSP